MEVSIASSKVHQHDVLICKQKTSSTFASTVNCRINNPHMSDPPSSLLIIFFFLLINFFGGMYKTWVVYTAVYGTKKAYTISPLAHLERVLNNPTIMPKLYFWHGVIRYEKDEFWHGNLWQDSPLFGEHAIRRNNEVSMNVICKVFKILNLTNDGYSYPIELFV
uniref:Uncharacterized protein n=1 Tax=Gigaspora margarita TaxID=4874 RepID=A0A8H3X454_GIGMA